MTQHYRMTQADAIAQYKDGLISSMALIYYYLKIKLAPDWKMTLHQRSVCKELGISKAAFYKGIQRLKDKGLIDWEAPNGVVVSFVQSEDTCNQSKIDNSRLFRGLLPGGIREDEWNLLAQAIKIFSELPWMVYDEPNPSITTIRSIVKQAILRQGQLGAVFLDYVQMLNLGGTAQNRNLELGQITRELRAIAKDFDVAFYLGSQINRDVEKRRNKRPTKADLRDSGEIAEAADAVIMLYRDAYYSKNPYDKMIEFIVDKNRIYGKVGTAKMLVNLETSRFLPIGGV